VKSKITEVTYAFVDSAPEQLESGKIYVSTKYRAIVHLCLCGCNEKVLLRLDPDDWSFTFDGRTVSIHDSVGNVGLPCRSHYFVRRNQVIWLRPLLDVDPKVALVSDPAVIKSPRRPHPRKLLAGCAAAAALKITRVFQGPDRAK
jgi:hypothetical protein